MADNTYKLRFTIPLDVVIDVVAEDDDAAYEKAEKAIKGYLGTIYGRRQDRLFADFGGDLPEPYEVEENGVIIQGAPEA